MCAICAAFVFFVYINDFLQFFFQRHCVTAQFLLENDYNYVLFIDADMGVINPDRRIEEYILYDKDIIFYNRIWNFEIMAGSFIAKYVF